MRLSDSKIKEYLRDARIVISPEPIIESITGVTVDVRLGKEFKVVNPNYNEAIDLSAPIGFREFQSTQSYRTAEALPGERFAIHPGEFLLASTLESITLPPTLVGWLDGRSTLARYGLMVHMTAHRIDPGWSGNVVLELFNCSNKTIYLDPGMKIGALSFETIEGTVETPYTARADAAYAYQIGTVGPGGV